MLYSGLSVKFWHDWIFTLPWLLAVPWLQVYLFILNFVDLAMLNF
jgi:hypothetical protein